MATLQNVVFITTFAGLALSLAIILLIVSQLGNDAKHRFCGGGKCGSRHNTHVLSFAIRFSIAQH